MPFDFAVTELAPIDSACIHGVPRDELRAHAMEQVAPALRGAVVEMELSEGGRFVHMGMVFEQVAWRAVWRRAGLPVASGRFAVWNGRPV